MALLTVDGLRPELSGYTISETSHPSEDEVVGFIADIETEVRALWAGAGGDWPDDPDAEGAEYPLLTIKLGSKWRYLDAVFAGAAPGGVPDSLAQSRLAYNDRLNRIPAIVAGSQDAEAEDQGLAPSSRPRVAVAGVPIDSGSTFGEWSMHRDPHVRYGPLSRMPWW